MFCVEDQRKAKLGRSSALIRRDLHFAVGDEVAADAPAATRALRLSPCSSDSRRPCLIQLALPYRGRGVERVPRMLTEVCRWPSPPAGRDQRELQPT